MDSRHALPATAVLLALAAPLPAQDARVYAANSSNGRIQLVSFAPPSSTTVNSDENQRTSLRSLAIRDDGVDGAHLIACDTLGGEVVFYAGAAGDGATIVSADGGGPALPDGVSLDPEGNLVLVSSGPGAAGQKIAQVWIVLRDLGDGAGHDALAGGYREPLGLLDDEVAGLTQIAGVDILLEA